MPPAARRLLPLLAMLTAACPSYRSETTAACEVRGDETVFDPHTGHCLIYYDAPRTWSAARLTCQLDVEGELAIVSDERENDLVSFLADERRVWLGASDLGEEGTWRWIDGAELRYESWGDGEPNDGSGSSSGGEDCMELNYGALGAWNDLPCDRLMPYICESSAL